VFDDGLDKTTIIEMDSLPYSVRIKSEWARDWAYVRLGQQGEIRYDKSRSVSLKAGEKTHVLGYSFGTQYQAGSLQPLYSASDIAVDGLKDGLIYLTQRSFETGNSGGPVFVQQSSGEYVAVGIVSAGRENIGFIVPVANINK